MFKGMSLQKFNRVFKDEWVCRQYLFKQKWGKGFVCHRCSHNEYWKGRTEFHARCLKCGYDESPTAQTIFHRMQIPLVKAFSIVFHVSVFKKGISTIELSKQFGIDEKTASRFRRRIQESMAAWISAERSSRLAKRFTAVDGIILIDRGKGRGGLQRVGIAVKTYSRGPLEPDLVQCESVVNNSAELDTCGLVAGHYVQEGKDIRIWNFKSWLTGTHHHCSEKYLNNYINEYFFRYNNRHRQAEVWGILIGSMVTSKPRYSS